MAQHDGSFLSVLSLDQSIEEGDLLDSSLNLSYSSSLDLLAESATQRLQSLHTSDNRTCANDTVSLTSGVCKRSSQYVEGWTLSSLSRPTHRKQAKVRPLCSDNVFQMPTFSEDFLSDLGVSKLPSDDSDVHSDNGLHAAPTSDDYLSADSHVYPTPSPQELCRDFKICNRFSGARAKVSSASLIHSSNKYPEITKNRAITLFDSPEDSKRGWSELGLRLRKPRPADTIPITGQGYFNFIADEIILNIFKMMPKLILVKCARVCKRWKRLAFDESLWRRLDASSKTLTAGALGDCILNRGCEVLRLSGAEIHHPIFSYGSLLPCKLQYLDLSMATVTTICLAEVLSQCKYLRKLSLENLTLNDEICSFISANRSLTTLNLAMAEGLNFSGLKHIFTQCSLLNELNIAWTKPSKDDVCSIVANLPQSLVRLNFSGCRENMTDNDVAVLVTSCPGLLELDLSDSLGLTESVISILYNNLTSIQLLHLSRCYYIIPESLRELRRLPELRSISLFSMMSDENLQAVSHALVGIDVNSELFSTVSRPTVSPALTSLWGLKVRDLPV